MKILYLHQLLYARDGSAVQGRELIRALRDAGNEGGNDMEVVVFPPESVQELGQSPAGSARKPGQLSLGAALRKSKRLIPGQIRRLLREVRNVILGMPEVKPKQEVLRTVQALKRVVDAERPDIVLARIGKPTLELIGAAVNWDVPLILQVNAPLFHEIPTVGYGSFSEEERELERKLWEAADAIMVLSSGLAEILRAQGVDEEKIFVNPLGVDPERFHPGIDGSVVRRRYQLLGKKVVGYVGKLSRIHDLETLIDAFALVLQTYDRELRLLLVGQGPEREQIEKQIESKGLGNHVILTGYVEYDAIPSYVAAMDVVTVPLVKENVIYSSPIKMFEYMAMAKPIVATSGGQVQEVLSDRETGLLVEPHSPQAMSKAILQLLSEPQWGIEMGQRAREVVCQQYTWKRNAEKIVRICQKLVG